MKFLSIAAFFLACACAATAEQRRILITEPIVITPRGAPEREIPPAERDYHRLFEQANDAFDAGDLDTAARIYHDILAHNPAYANVPYCYYNLGLIAFKRRNYEEAEGHFKAAYLLLGDTQDKSDALLLRSHCLARLERWQEIPDIIDEALSGDLAAISLDAPVAREILLRRAEAIALLGRPDEARTSVQRILFGIRREHPRGETFFIPEFAMANFIMGRTFVAEFAALPFEATLDRLTEKCRLIQNAQQWFLETIRVGVIYWTNAAAYELASLYRTLFDEMNRHPVPSELITEEERTIYRCELWEKTAGLLRKARRTLTGSIESAKRIHEHNEFIEESLRLLVEVNAAYAEKESLCRPRGTDH